MTVILKKLLVYFLCPSLWLHACPIMHFFFRGSSALVKAFSVYPMQTTADTMQLMMEPLSLKGEPVALGWFS